MINDRGVDFLKCFSKCSSLSELEMKMQLMGY